MSTPRNMVITLVVLTIASLAYNFLRIDGKEELFQHTSQDGLALAQTAKDGSTCIHAALAIDTAQCAKDNKCREIALQQFAAACLTAVGKRNPDLLVNPCDFSEAEFNDSYCSQQTPNQSVCELLGEGVRSPSVGAMCENYYFTPDT